MTLLSSTDELAAFCDRLKSEDAIAVDTEFMREKTYWSKLCLVQVSGTSEAAAIDPLAAGMDLRPLFDLMSAPQPLKVFHAARQDLEIFYSLTGHLPTPIFDTQLAAMVCGFGDQVAYETLVAKLVRAKLDKGSRFTDWSLRPLSQRQIDYALGDVTYLLPVYTKLRAKLEENGRAEWLAAELTQLTDPASYEMDPQLAYRRIKHRSSSGRLLAVLRELAAWRESEARSRNIPRTWVLRDESLLEIAHQRPATPEELARTRGLGRKFVDGGQGGEVLAAVARGLELPDGQLPEPRLKRDLPKSVGPVSDLLKVLLKMKCDSEGVAQRLIASADDVERIAAFGEDADVSALNGWRRRVFGEDALKVRKGELALAVNGRKMVLVDLNGAESNAGES